MKKLIIFIIAACLIPTLLWAGSVEDVLSVIARKSVGSVTYDCSGDLKFGWGMENTTITSGTPAGCSDGDTTATLQTATISAAQKTNGTNSLYCPGAQDWAQLDVTADDIFSDNDGYLSVDIYLTTWITSGDILRIRGDSSNELILVMVGASGAVDFRMYFRHGGTLDSVIRDFNYNEASPSWVRIYYYWKVGVAGADNKLKVCDLTPPNTESNCVESEEDDDLTAWATAPSDIWIGEWDNEATVYYLDNLEIYGTSGY